MKNARERLERVLRSVYDDDDFAIGTLACLKTDENCEEMLEVIRYADSVGDELTHDDLVALSIVIRKRSDSRQ